MLNRRAIRDNFRLFLSLDKAANHNGQVEWQEWLDSFTSKQKDPSLTERRRREMMAAAKAAWRESARSNPEALNIDEFLSFTHPEVSHSLRLQVKILFWNDSS